MTLLYWRSGATGIVTIEARPICSILHTPRDGTARDGTAQTSALAMPLDRVASKCAIKYTPNHSDWETM